MAAASDMEKRRIDMDASESCVRRSNRPDPEMSISPRSSVMRVLSDQQADTDCDFPGTFRYCSPGRSAP
ncbi:hypothetical protein GCM10007147_10060 [Nocardiopsis kunsanensis]|uniref:Uncharacterized protein n=1 Tax=Nocardiopsis kunsanensis TaxID=141693 RepID=A0A918X952_9ACTN|nr:hypothetical protein GCM10007147_10060 [Nocardiopsis kunsanensis]